MIRYQLILIHNCLKQGFQDVYQYPKRLTSDGLNDRVRPIACADKIAAFLEDRPYRRRI